MIILAPIILSKENLDSMPHGLNGVGVGAGFGILEVYAVVDGAMRIIQQADIAIRTPAIADDLGAGFYPANHCFLQRGGGPVLYRNKEYST
jgi:hypothetical protein